MDLEYIGFIVLLIFFFSAAVQLFYYAIIFLRFVFFKVKKESPNTTVPVSIIICAKNEAENLEKNLHLILKQDYPDFEVVVVNDCSNDDSEDILKRYKLEYKNLKTTFIKEDEKFSHGKKLALTVGIKSAKNEWLLLTDADCFPESDKWLSTMAAQFSGTASIVLGYGGYSEGKGFLNKLIRYDTAIIALQYFSFALFGKPYMGVGRNLAYRKSLFFANKGFASHARLESGDDDLFINEVANSNNVVIEPSTMAHTRSEAKKTFYKWTGQKMRHFTTFPLYNKKDIYLLGTENISRVVFYISFVLLLIYQEYWIIATSVFFVRLVLQLIVFKITFKRLNERNLFIISPLFDLILPFISLGIYLSNALRPRSQWR
jgi:glycosyltransferase involved in cell wall biosynthesis